MQVYKISYVTVVTDVCLDDGVHIRYMCEDIWQRCIDMHSALHDSWPRNVQVAMNRCALHTTFLHQNTHIIYAFDILPYVRTCCICMINEGLHY